MARRPLPPNLACHICRICDFPCFEDCLFRPSPGNPIYYYPDGRRQTVAEIFDNTLYQVDLRETELEQERVNRTMQVVPVPEDSESVNMLAAAAVEDDTGEEIHSAAPVDNPNANPATSDVNLVPIYTAENAAAGGSNSNLGPSENVTNPTAMAAQSGDAVAERVASSPTIAQNQENAGGARSKDAEGQQ